jgi:hypothetical protein
MPHCGNRNDSSSGVWHQHGRLRADTPLAAVGYLWTFAALRLSTGARARGDRRGVAGDRHTAARRHLFTRFLGYLYDCLQTGETDAEHQGFPAAQPIAA